MYRPAQDSPSQELADAPITLETLGWIRRNYYSNRSNLQLMDLDTTVEEVRKYSEVGGGAIVDATTAGIGRKPDALAKISLEAGVHIIMGAGWSAYTGLYSPVCDPLRFSSRATVDGERSKSAAICRTERPSACRQAISHRSSMVTCP